MLLLENDIASQLVKMLCVKINMLKLSISHLRILSLRNFSRFDLFTPAAYLVFCLFEWALLSIINYLFFSLNNFY